MSTKNMYNETDLRQAAFLLARGFRLIGLEPTEDPKRLAFCFEDDGSIPGAICDYANNTEVPAREYAEALDLLKSRLYAAKRQCGRR